MLKQHDLARLTRDNYIDTCNVLASKYVNGRYYVILMYASRSVRNDGRGNCGAGYEWFLGWLQIDKAGNINQFKHYLNSSCLHGYLEDRYSFDDRNPQKGIKSAKIHEPEKAVPANVIH